MLKIAATNWANLTDQLWAILDGETDFTSEQGTGATQDDAFLFSVMIAFLEFSYGMGSYIELQTPNPLEDMKKQDKTLVLIRASMKLGVALCWLHLNKKEDASLYLRELDFDGALDRAGFGVQDGQFSDLLVVLDQGLDRIRTQWEYLDESKHSEEFSDLDIFVASIIYASLYNIHSLDPKDYNGIFQLHAIAGSIMVWLKLYSEKETAN